MAANQADNTAERFVEEWLQQGKATRTAAEAAQARAERIEYAKERMEASPSVMRVPIGSQFHAKDRSAAPYGESGVLLGYLNNEYALVMFDETLGYVVAIPVSELAAGYFFRPEVFQGAGCYYQQAVEERPRRKTGGDVLGKLGFKRDAAGRPSW